MRLITLLVLGLAATAVAQTITVTGPIGPLYCGFTYTITWTSTALASNTPLTIQLWNNNVGPDTQVLELTTAAANTGSYNWAIPTNNNNVLGTDEMYFYIFVTGGSTAGQGADNTITHGSITNVRVSNTAPSIGSPVSINWNFAAPSVGTVTVSLRRNTSPPQTISTLASAWPITNTITFTPSSALTPASDYFITVTLEQDPLTAGVGGSSSTFTILAAVSNTSATSATTVTGVTQGTTIGNGAITQGVTVGNGVTAATTGGGGVSVAWGGRYNVQAGCDTNTCCCLTGAVLVTQNGLTVAFSGQLTGNCGGETSLVASATLPSTSATSTTFTLFNNDYIASRSGAAIVVSNLSAPQCSGTATCENGACAANSGTSSAASAIAPLISGALAIVAAVALA